MEKHDTSRKHVHTYFYIPHIPIISRVYPNTPMTVVVVCMCCVLWICEVYARSATHTHTRVHGNHTDGQYTGYDRGVLGMCGVYNETYT